MQKKVGLEVGDNIKKIGEIEPDRDSLWKLFFVLFRLAPSETLDLTVKKNDASEKTLTVKAKITPNKEYLAELKKRKDKEKSEPVKCAEINKEIVICKLYTFDATETRIEGNIDVFATVACQIRPQVVVTEPRCKVLQITVLRD